MSFNAEEYPELQNDIFDRYDCNDVENMSLQEFTEIVQYDYHNISFDFSKELCRPKWEDCQDRRIELDEMIDEEFTIKEFVEITGMNPNTARRELGQGAKKGLFKRVGKGKYQRL